MGRRKKKGQKKKGEAIKSFPAHPDFKDRNITAIESLKRKGKELKHPFSELEGKLSFTSWINESIPNLLWVCILTSFLERSQYLSVFRAIIKHARENLEIRKSLHITHNFCGAMDDATFDTFMKPVLEHKEALSWLRGLRLIDSLPDQHHWHRHAPEPDSKQDWNILIHAVADNYDHQSQKATDIRWFKLMYVLICREQLILPQDGEFVEELRLYPDKGDMRSVRPTIRALEISTREIDKSGTVDGDDADRNLLTLPDFHSDLFWAETLKKVSCISLPDTNRPTFGPKELVTELIELFEKVDHHFFATLQTSSPDPRHDGAFGLALYALTFLLNSAHGYTHLRPDGRILLRTIAESYITLHYLTKKDDPSLWEKYRRYGAGQTKLAFLKYLREAEVPDFIDLEMMEHLANEDMWLEFENIDLGNWASLDLRKMSIEADCKDVYDSYYGWTSSFSHGQWAAVRDSVFTNCLNPLHRYHRIPAFPKGAMSSTLIDGCKLCNRVLDDLNQLYPSFKPRIKWHNQKSDEDKVAE